MPEVTLNFHHLRHFWAVAHEGNLTRAARKLRISPSALSTQIRQLEEQLGHTLFAREGRGLLLTEAGRVALAHADEVFASGSALVETMRHGRTRDAPLRVGSVATLSRNFQESFLAPLLGVANVRLSLRSGALDDLLARLAAHDLDVVLSNRAPPRSPESPWRARRVARQQVSLVGRKRSRAFRFPHGLAGAPLVVPGPESDVRAEFDALCGQLGLTVRIVAEVDDMATLRLLARDMDAIALVPSVVVRDELRTGALHEHCVVPGVYETFFAVEAARKFQHPLLRELFARDERDLLAMTP